MRKSLLLILGSLLLGAGPARAAGGDTVADRVLGQGTLTTSIPYFVDGRVFSAADVAIDRSAVPNRIYVADVDLNRVLGWSDVQRFRAGEAADLVLGQPSLLTGQLIFELQNCTLPPSKITFCRPSNLAVDGGGNLYVVDSFNFRVLELDSPFTTDRVADRVFGQADFTSHQHSGISPPTSQGVTVDAAGNVWMADPTQSFRVLEFDAPLTHDTQADRVIEPDAKCSAGFHDGLCNPGLLRVSPQGDLYVEDSGRLWVFRQPLTTDLVADFSPSFGVPGMVFDPAGNLIYSAGLGQSFLGRLPAPIGPDTQAEQIFHASTLGAYGRLDRDSQGNLYVGAYGDTGSGPSAVYLYDPPFQTEPEKIGRSRLTNQGLDQPLAVAVDRSSSPNHLYVADRTNRVLGWRDAAGFANGAPADLVLDGNDPRERFCSHNPNGISASHFCFDEPLLIPGMAVDSRGNLWLSDITNNRVLELDRPFDTDGIADRVLGQGGSFTTRGCNQGHPEGPSAASLCLPGALAFDRKDNLYVADLYNSRVLLFVDPLRDQVADKIFGQPSFRRGSCGSQIFGRRTTGFCFMFDEGDLFPHINAAAGLAVDPQGNLYVADPFNARVLIFKDAARSDAAPDAVLGQDGQLWTSFSRMGGAGARRFFGANRNDFPPDFGPSGLAIGPDGELYVADAPNDRVLVFADPLHADRADRVFGHEGFDAGGASLLFFSMPPASERTLLRPHALAFDVDGNLYVADTFNNRVLAFDRP